MKAVALLLACALCALGAFGCSRGKAAGKAAAPVRVEWEALLASPEKLHQRRVELAGVLRFRDATVELTPTSEPSPLPIAVSFAGIPIAEKTQRGFDRLYGELGPYVRGKPEWVHARLVGMLRYRSPREGPPQFGYLNHCYAELVVEQVLEAAKVSAAEKRK